MAIPPNMHMNDFDVMKRGEWTESNENKIKYRKAFPKDYALPATGTEGKVCDDIAARQRMGVNKYGTTVCANPLELKQWLQHAYEEALDQAIYLRRAIQELEKNG